MQRVEHLLSLCLEKLAKQVCRNPLLVLSLSVLLFGLAGWLAYSKLGVLNNTNDLIDQDSPDLKNFLAYLEEFETKDPMVIVIESEDLEANKKVADELGRRIEEKHEGIDKVFYKIDFGPLMRKLILESNLTEKIRPHGLLYKSEQELKEIVATISSYKDILSSENKEQQSGVNFNSLLDNALLHFDKVAEKRGGKGDA